MICRAGDFGSKINECFTDLAHYTVWMPSTFLARLPIRKNYMSNFSYQKPIAEWGYEGASRTGSADKKRNRCNGETATSGTMPGNAVLARGNEWYFLSHQVLRFLWLVEYKTLQKFKLFNKHCKHWINIDSMWGVLRLNHSTFSHNREHVFFAMLSIKALPLDFFSFSLLFPHSWQCNMRRSTQHFLCLYFSCRWDRSTFSHFFEYPDFQLILCCF